MPEFTCIDASAACEIARQKAISGDTEKAVEILETVLERFPVFFEALVTLAQLQEMSGQSDAAISYYEQASVVNPGHAKPFTRRSILLLRQHLNPQVTPPPFDPARPAVMMSNLGSNGRFGNQLLQYGLLRLYAERVGAQVLTPDWIGRDLFGLNDGFSCGVEPTDKMDEPEIISLLSGQMSRCPTGVVDTSGFFIGNTALWAAERAKYHRLFEPVGNVRVMAEESLSRLRAMGRTIVGVHVRRGDFTGGQYWPTPIEWYISWLKEFWDHLPDPVFYLASDDPEVVNEFTQFSVMTDKDIAVPLPGAEFFIDHWILRNADILATSNSSFSMTAALLNSRSVHFWRPDRQIGALRSFDPWAEPVILD